MDKEFLDDYEQKEIEEHEKFRKLVIQGDFGPTDIFPPKERFIKMSEPIAFSVQPEPDIWPQIPFAGSTVLMLSPVRENLFKKKNGFEISEIDRIVDFVKETGKIQFVIEWPPAAFEGLDFLDPIFTELKPPTYPWPSELYPLTEIQRKQTEIEFDTLAEISFHNFIKEVFSKQISKDKYFFAKRMHDYKMDYTAVKALGHQDLLEELGDYMVSNPPKAFQAFLVIGAFITLPLVNPLKATLNYDLNLFMHAKEYVKVKNPTFSYEIGKFLIKKLTYYPNSLTACQELIAHYKDYDLLELLAALNTGIKESKIDLVNANTEALSKTLDAIWSDKKIQNKVEGITLGVPLSLAALGAVAAGPVGALGGFLGGLGFSVGSTILKIGKEKLGEKAAKLISQSYQINIFDFKKKYHLK